MRSIAALTLIGLTGCNAATDAALCGPDLASQVASLRSGLEAHPETPDAVGEPATSVVLGYEAGCK